MLAQLAFAGTIPLDQNSDRVIRSARSRNRAAAWQYDLARWRSFHHSRLTSQDDLAKVDAEYQQLLEQGPDFIGYHRESEFREPPKLSITREDRIRILTMFDGIRAGLYKHCRSERGQAVSRNYRDVLGVLLSFAVKRGRVFPSLDTIARLALVSKRTVQHAIAWLALYGFLDKLRRITRRQGMLGQRTVQTSNAYVMRFPRGLGGLAAGVFCFGADGNNCHPSESNSAVKKRLSEEEGADPALFDALSSLGASVAGNSRSA
jgi:Helix-turn-helix domain